MQSIRISEEELVVSLGDAKAYFRILHEEEDALIERVLRSATEQAEQITNRVLKRATFLLTIEDFSNVTLERTPFVWGVSVSYIDNAGERVLLPSTYYNVSIDDSARATLSFVSVPDDYFGSIEITYDAGYEKTPAQIETYILSTALTLFENREHIVVGTMVSTKVANLYKRLLDSYRVIPV